MRMTFWFSLCKESLQLGPPSYKLCTAISSHPDDDDLFSKALSTMMSLVRACAKAGRHNTCLTDAQARMMPWSPK